LLHLESAKYKRERRHQVFYALPGSNDSVSGLLAGGYVSVNPAAGTELWYTVEMLTWGFAVPHPQNLPRMTPVRGTTPHSGEKVKSEGGAGRCIRMFWLDAAMSRREEVSNTAGA
jgi:hypothetical protein